MREISPRQRFLPALFERLRDYPARSNNTFEQQAPDAATMQRMIQRDLSLLLNTSNLGQALDADRYPEVARSVVNYGLPPLSGTLRASHNPALIEKLIREAIIRFEPRLIPESLSVRVQPQTDGKSYNRIRLEIQSLMHWSPHPVAFLLQSLYDLESSHLSFDARP